MCVNRRQGITRLCHARAHACVCVCQRRLLIPSLCCVCMCSQPLAKIVRYMTLANRRDNIDAALAFISEWRFRRVPAQLKKSWDTARRRLVQLQKEYEQARETAIKQKADPEEAMTHYVQTTCDQPVTTNVGRDYHEVRGCVRVVRVVLYSAYVWYVVCVCVCVYSCI